MNLVQQLQQRTSKKCKALLFVGDAMWDRWVHGTVQTCQDYCHKFMESEIITTPGGVANAKNCLTNWQNVLVRLESQSNYQCIIKTRFVDGYNKIVFRWDDEKDCTNGRDSHLEHAEARNLAINTVEFVSAVLLSDYDKGFLTPSFIQEIVARCQKYNIPCVADCKREPETYAGCILKGNRDYWSQYSAPIGAEIVMTCGADDPQTLYAVALGGKELPPVSLVNHVGAGDCFAAHLTLALAYGFSFRESATIAHSAGRVYVQHPHNRPPHPHEIAADMDSITAQ